MMFTCSKCNVERKFDHRDYYDFDHYICPQCGDDFTFPADGYYIPDDDDDEYDELDYMDEYEDMLSQCGMTESGACTLAGTEHCDFHCNINWSEVFGDEPIETDN